MLSLGKPSFWKNVQPVGALSDFRAVYHQAGSKRWLFTLLAMATTIGIFSVMAAESWKLPPPRPKVIYINSWTADRSDAEIRASNLANQKIKDRDAAEQAARDEKVKGVYRALGKASGMDVDAIEKQAQADARASEAAEAKALGVKSATPAPQAAPKAEVVHP